MTRFTILALTALLAGPALAQEDSPAAENPSSETTTAATQPRDAADMVRIPVEEGLEGTAISPASDADLEKTLRLFSETPGYFSQQDGETLYFATCAACHMPDGKGAAGAGAHPPLSGNPKLVSKYYVATVLLTGYHGMPRFGNTMHDDQIAAVTNYVRTHFGNSFDDALSAEEVGRLRAPGY